MNLKFKQLKKETNPTKVSEKISEVLAKDIKEVVKKHKVCGGCKDALN